MSNHQLFAKIGVLVLLGLNVGAYYVFWPSREGGSRSEAKGPKEEKGTAQLLPTRATAAKPKQIAATALANAVPLETPLSAKKGEKEVSPDEAVSKLLDHIKKEAENASNPLYVANPPNVPKGFDERIPVFPEPKENLPKKVEFPSAPTRPDEPTPKALPPLKGEPLLPEANNPDVGVTPAKGTAGSWKLQAETVGTQTLLIAQLRQPARQPVEFRIWCDRVDTKGPGSDVQAIGKVTFVGPGLKGTCQRLTLAFYDPRVAFEEQVYLLQESLGSTLRGERIFWDLPAELTPAGSK